MRRPGSKVRAQVWSFGDGELRKRADQLAAEEPLEIRVVTQDSIKTVAVTMRTPGNDFELAAGFLYSEGVIRAREDVATISYCLNPKVDVMQQYNIVNVALRHARPLNLDSLERHFFTSSACGVCGKASLEALQIQKPPPLADGPVVSPAVLHSLPVTLRASQGLFDKTGGLHAAALFTPEGELVELREDVGRHNALDKLVGWALLEDKLPLRECLLLVSGRSSFELVQKCVMAGVPVLCAVSAPSSLAVTVARAFGLTLIGFLREKRFNVYSGIGRIDAAQKSLASEASAR